MKLQLHLALYKLHTVYFWKHAMTHGLDLISLKDFTHFMYLELILEEIQLLQAVTLGSLVSTVK